MYVHVFLLWCSDSSLGHQKLYETIISLQAILRYLINRYIFTCSRCNKEEYINIVCGTIFEAVILFSVISSTHLPVLLLCAIMIHLVV